jgi:transcriptional regulator with XRE-family HTH domain
VSALKNLRLNLRRLRKEQGLTQEEVAERAGLDYRHYQRIEVGKWPGLQLHTVEMLAKVFKVEVHELFRPT